MATMENHLTEAYLDLSRLYKNPTRPLGLAANDQNALLAAGHKRLLRLFRRKFREHTTRTAQYYKVLSLLYEVGNYLGRSSRVSKLVQDECKTLIQTPRKSGQRTRFKEASTLDLNNADVRSLLKAQIRVCVAAVESLRKEGDANELLKVLDALEVFTKDKLHQPKKNRPAWTTLAFIQTAQARIGRQTMTYSFVRGKLFSAMEYLNERAEDLIAEVAEFQNKKSNLSDEIERVADDLVFIRQKQTLQISINLGLAALQHGWLRSAEGACKAARLQFRFHGQFFHRLFNELVILSIQRAQTPRAEEGEFQKLKAELEPIIKELRPIGNRGNPRLYLYGLRELALLRYYCREIDPMLETLKDMEAVQPQSQAAQWILRINTLRARAYWRAWVDRREPQANVLLHLALACCETALKKVGLNKKIEAYSNSARLAAGIRQSPHGPLVDLIEMLIMYGSVQLGLAQSFPETRLAAIHEAIKSAGAVVRICKNDNPRLHAMGHLVLAECYTDLRQLDVAREHLVWATVLEPKIDHRYVIERREEVAKKLNASTSTHLNLDGFESIQFEKAQDLVFEWFVENKVRYGSKSVMASALGMGLPRFKSFLKRMAVRSPHHPLVHLLDTGKKPGRPKKT